MFVRQVIVLPVSLLWGRRAQDRRIKIFKELRSEKPAEEFAVTVVKKRWGVKSYKVFSLKESYD